MKKLLIILIATAITVLNVRSYGDIDDKEKAQAIEMAKSPIEITLEKTFDWTIGFGVFKFIHFTELLILSQVTRKFNLH